MSRIIKNYRRKCISIPEELDKIIEYKYRSSNYTYMNDMIIELLELGLIKLNDNEMKMNKNDEIISKLDEIISMINK